MPWAFAQPASSSSALTSLPAFAMRSFSSSRIVGFFSYFSIESFASVIF
jgi:hypothetical protein